MSAGEEQVGEALCRLQEIADPGSKGFEREGGSIFIVRRGMEVAGYVNSCPLTYEWSFDLHTALAGGFPVKCCH